MDYPRHLFFSQCTKKRIIGQNVRKCKAYGKMLMLTNGAHLSFSKMLDLLFFWWKYTQMSSYIEYFIICRSRQHFGSSHEDGYLKKIFINVHMQERHVIYLRSCANDLFYTKLYYLSMITNPINTSIKSYSFLSTMKKNWIFTDSEVEGARKIQELQQQFYWTGTSNFKSYLREGMTINFPITT